MLTHAYTPTGACAEDPPRPDTASTLRGAASDMCQSDLFTLVNCLKAPQLDAVHPS